MALLPQILSELDSAPASAQPTLVIIFVLLTLAFRFNFLQLPPLLFHIDIIELISLADPVLPQQFKQDNIVFFDPFPDPEPVAVEASHPQYFQQHVDDERVVDGHDQLYVAGVAGALQSPVAACAADHVSFVGRHSQKRVIETAAFGLLIVVVNLRFLDLADAEPPDFFRREKAKLDGLNLKPLAHGMYIALHDC